MINLQELEKEIDTLLNNETRDSLTAWLLNKRFGNLNELTGEDSFVDSFNQGKPFTGEQPSKKCNQTAE